MRRESGESTEGYLIMDIMKGDLVEVISGNDRGQKRGDGKKGRVLFIDREKGKVIVEGVNMIRRHTKPSQQNPQGGIVEKEAQIPASNVLLVSPRLNRGVRIRHDRLEDGTRVRVCSKTGEIIPTPSR
jgi:large subunit ribosomal protein L24